MEGVDQAGKTTQVQLLADALGRNGLTTETFEFPDYSTPVGRQIKASLDLGGAAGYGRPPPQLLHTLLAANRWETLARIRAALEAKDVVLMNRYYHSNLAYGLARGLDRRWLENLDAGLPRSDLVIVLDIDAAESFRRKSSGRDRFEGNKGLLEKVRTRYCDEACLDKEHWRVVNAVGTRPEVHARVLAAAAPVVNALCGTRIEPAMPAPAAPAAPTALHAALRSVAAGAYGADARATSAAAPGKT